MAEAQEKYVFPDEKEQEPKTQESQAGAPEVEIEVVDDTPPQDRGREPLPKEIVKELEEDNLEEYSERVKQRLSQMKKVWHDERREKERAAREREEALRYAEAKDQEIKKLRSQLGAGEKVYTEEMTKAANSEVDRAKERLREAYEDSDPQKIADAQEALTDAKIKLRELKYFKPASLQAENNEVEIEQQAQEPQRAAVADPKAEAWRAKNTWFGADDEMTALALGLHNKLVRSGVDPRSDEYYRHVDETMKKRFPEYFDEKGETQTTEVEVEKPAPRTKPTVVAPATRSTAPKKVRLTQTQLALAKRFGLTPEAYAKELLKLENANG